MRDLELIRARLPEKKSTEIAITRDQRVNNKNTLNNYSGTQSVIITSTPGTLA
jgi:hypothetical protein